MLERFEGTDGSKRVLQCLQAQGIVRNDADVAQDLFDSGKLRELTEGEDIIRQDTYGSDFFFILQGRFSIIVNGNYVGERGYGDHLGEVASLDPGQKRSATVKALEASVVLQVDGEVVRALAFSKPSFLEAIAVEANKRLAQRNARDQKRNEKPHVVLVSSKEALPIVEEIESLLRAEDYLVRPWHSGGVFELSAYPIPSLTQALDEADFVIVVAQGDDRTVTRHKQRSTPRDNVTFEMGMAIGKVSLDRTIIVAASDKTELGTDLNGVTVARYRSDQKLADALRPVCTDIKKHINQRGPKR